LSGLELRSGGGTPGGILVRNTELKTDRGAFSASVVKLDLAAVQVQYSTHYAKSQIAAWGGERAVSFQSAAEQCRFRLIR
jgi:hypothetical protein